MIRRLFRTVLLQSIAASVAVVGLASEASAAPWVPCGNLATLSPITCQTPGFPLTRYEYGIAYNTKEPLPVVCTYWNVGARIANKDPYFVFSDDPSKSLNYGGFVFYQNTYASDDDPCAGGYRHRYWILGANNSISTLASNGCYSTNQLVYCRLR